MLDIQLKLMSTKEDHEVYALVETEFMEFVKDDCTEAGVEMFFEAVRYILYDKPDNYFVLIAKENDAIIGMIAVGDHYHISLFFVKRAHQGKRVGRKLFEAALKQCLVAEPKLLAMDVHSSLYAVPIYEHLGFKRKSGTELKNGIRFVKMLYKVS